MSSFKLSQPPLRVHPIADAGPAEGLFTPQWESWFTSVWQLLRTLQTALPVFINWTGTYAGGGTAFDQSITITVPSAANLYVFGTWVHGFSTAAPNWQVQIKVDGSVIYDSGASVAQWQQCVAGNGQVAVTAGQHTVDILWTASTSNGVLTRANLVVIPELTT